MSMTNFTAKNMNKFLLALLIVLISLSVTAQVPPPSASEKAALDSMLNNDEFLKLLDSLDKPVSYLDLSAGIGNQLFSLNNNALNSQQADVKKLFFTPAISYIHKSGLGLTVTGFLTTDSGSMKMYQTALTASYDYIGKKVAAGISYTRYFSNKSLSIVPSPYQDEIYAYVKLSKGWIEPKFSVGYANGRFKEYFDSSFIVNMPPPAHTVHLRDTISTKVKDFSLSFSIEHDFSFADIFSKKDGLAFIPALMITANSENLTTTHSNNLNKRRPVIQNLLKSKYGNGSSSASLEPESLALSLELTYTLGKFYLQPDLYLDYYLPSTTANRLTDVFSVTAGFTF